MKASMLPFEDTCVQVHRLQVLYWTCPGGVQGLAEVDGATQLQMYC